MLRIGHGSDNKDKIDSLIAACILARARPELTNGKTDSRIPPQPKTFGQMRRGAENRAKEMRERYPDLDIYIGVESGIQEDYNDSADDIGMDFAMVAILYGDDQWAYSTSPGVIFPREFMHAWAASPHTGTVGDIIAARLGGTKSDPHRTLTGGRITRPQTLVYGMVCALEQLPPEILYR